MLVKDLYKYERFELMYTHANDVGEHFSDHLRLLV